jgi:DUF917 family protein
MGKNLDLSFAKALVYGGAILGGGGGGNIEEGLEFVNETFKHGAPILLSPDEIANDSLVVTCAMVGAPSSKKKLSPLLSVSSLQFFQENFKKHISGIITNEMVHLHL